MAILFDGHIQTIKQMAAVMGLSVTGYWEIQISLNNRASYESYLREAIVWLINDSRTCNFDYHSERINLEHHIGAHGYTEFVPRYAVFYVTSPQVAVEFKLRFGQ